MTATALPSAGAASKAAFIDRDGVINRELHYVHRIADFELLPGAVEGLALLRAQGFRLVVVTNQAGIGRGLYTEQDYQTLTAHMQGLLRAGGVELDGVYHCPHAPGAGADGADCRCRKPAPGMLLDAAHDLRIDLAASVLVGDKAGDIEAGRRAGLRACVLVRSGHALSERDIAGADACEADLLAAARWLAGPGAAALRRLAAGGTAPANVRP